MVSQKTFWQMYDEAMDEVATALAILDEGNPRISEITAHLNLALQKGGYQRFVARFPNPPPAVQQANAARWAELLQEDD